jgi:hypothetical protein
VSVSSKRSSSKYKQLLASRTASHNHYCEKINLKQLAILSPTRYFITG